MVSPAPPNYPYQPPLQPLIQAAIETAETCETTIGELLDQAPLSANISGKDFEKCLLKKYTDSLKQALQSAFCELCLSRYASANREFMKASWVLSHIPENLITASQR